MTTQEIENGMKLLDEKGPALLSEILGEEVKDWRPLIKLPALNMQFCGCCILGQLFGYYFDGLVKLEILTEDEAACYEFEAEEIARSLGFHADSEYGWEELTNQWKQALSEEKEQVNDKS